VLAEDDAHFLDEKGWSFAVQSEGDLINLVISNYELPSGYNVTHTDLLLRLPAGFPDARPDMFWLSPAVAYQDGQIPSGSEQREDHLGRNWQRWSRHLGDRDWRPGIDTLQSYLRFVRTNLEAAPPGSS
jgi:hypothetical protein